MVKPFFCTRATLTFVDPTFFPIVCIKYIFFSKKNNFEKINFSKKLISKKEIEKNNFEKIISKKQK